MFKYITAIVFFLVVGNAFSQRVPQGVNYQALIRDNAGDPVANYTGAITIQLTDGSGGTTIYEEDHNVTGNAYGVVSFVIGSGLKTVGNDFNDLDWTLDVYINVLVGGLSLGPSAQLQSVPYALRADEVFTLGGIELNIGGTIPDGHVLTYDQPSNRWIARATDSSPWITNGSDIYYTAASGKVGIGLNNPDASLHVGERYADPFGDESIMISRDGGDSYLEMASGDMSEGVIFHGNNTKDKRSFIVNNIGAGTSNSITSILPSETFAIGTEGSKPMQLMTNGVSRLTIAETGNVSLGTGLMSSNETLNVFGSVKVEDEYTYGSAKTRYLSLSFTDFSPQHTHEDDFQKISGKYGIVVDVGTDVEATGPVLAPVHLPDGAVITEVKWYLATSNSVTSPGLILKRSTFGSNVSPVTIASSGTVLFSGTTVVEGVDTTISGGAVSNANYSYWMRCFLRPGQQLYGARITYTVTQAD